MPSPAGAGFLWSTLWPALTQAGSRTLDCRVGGTGASTTLCLVERPPSGLPETAVFPGV